MYNIRSVSQLVGIPAVTIRAWEMRYEVVIPTRSKGGHRIYSQQDIEDLLWLKKQIDQSAMSISQAAGLLKKNKTIRLTALNREKPMPLTEEFAVREELEQQLFEMNTTKVHAILDRAFHLFSFEYVIHRVLVPFLVQVGDKWQRGEIIPAQEHFISTLIMQRCMQFGRLFPTNNKLPKTLAICPEGEQHQIGLLLFSLYLRRHGVDVIYLGANTPLEGIERLIVDLQVERFVFSVTMDEAVRSANRFIEQLAPFYRYLKFMVGGAQATNPELDHRFFRIGNYEKDWEMMFERHWNHSRLLVGDATELRYPTGG